MTIEFQGKVAVVTGAGNGLGKAHAMLLASRGAKVVVNDYGASIRGEGNDQAAADIVVSAIKNAGGIAVANYNSVEDGDQLIETAIKEFGRIDIVINNAGFLRDTSFHKMTENDWSSIMNVHLNGSFRVARAAWPYMREQRFGRIVNTASAAGIYGNFGQVNYSAAKLALHGMTQALAIEGKNRNIHVNTVAPAAASRLTDTVISREQTKALRADLVSPIVAYLCHENSTETGSLFEAGAGWFGKLRWERTKGKNLGNVVTPEDVEENWGEITSFEDATHPDNISSAFAAFGDIMSAAVGS